jgi:hypothetical protein
MKTTNHPLIALSEQEIFDEAYCGRYRSLEEPCVDEVYRGEYPYYLDEVYLDDRPECVLDLVCGRHETPSEWLSPEVDNFWKVLDIDPETVNPERKKFLALLRLTDNADKEDDPLEVLSQFALDHGLRVPVIKH